MRSPSLTKAQVRWSMIRWPGRLKCSARKRSAIAMPTALPTPWPSGPVVVSTPGVWPRSGWPGVLEPHWRNAAQVVERQVVARQVEQGILQHGGVAAGEDEPVAVGPVGIGGIVPEEPVPEHVGRGGERHGGARVAGLGCLHRVHGQRPDGVDAAPGEASAGRPAAGAMADASGRCGGSSSASAPRVRVLSAVRTGSFRARDRRRRRAEAGRGRAEAERGGR